MSILIFAISVKKCIIIIKFKVKNVRSYKTLPKLAYNTLI